jgi:hypothetical protein
MPVIRKTFGEFPLKTFVNTTEVSFDAEGLAEVEQEIFDALLTVPGFEANEAEESPSEVEDEDSETEDEQTSEDESTEEAPAPKPSRKRPSIKK